jgi:O-phosphoseryl-tRNA(Cys) synthetase
LLFAGEEKVDRARDIFAQYKRQNVGTGDDEVVATADLRDMLLDMKVEVSGKGRFPTFHTAKSDRFTKPGSGQT